MVHAASLDFGSLLHVHELVDVPGAVGFNRGPSLQAAVAGDLPLAGHAGHTFAGATASRELMYHFGPEAGHPGAPAGAFSITTSVAHVTSHPPG